jgi:hypothetical protein
MADTRKSDYSAITNCIEFASADGRRNGHSLKNG